MENYKKLKLKLKIKNKINVIICNKNNKYMTVIV